jgi:hypothetical protein
MTFIYRKAKPDDIDEIVELAVESVSRDPLPVRVNRQAMRAMAMQTLNPAHFMWVTEESGRIVAAVAAQAQKIFWADGLQVSVLLFYSKVKGAGAALLREFARWVKSRHGIKLAVFELEPSADHRLEWFLRRLGFCRESRTLSFVRGVA